MMGEWAKKRLALFVVFGWTSSRGKEIAPAMKSARAARFNLAITMPLAAMSQNTKQYTLNGVSDGSPLGTQKNSQN
jgi:hypothetical protein